jgi:predicted component of type VI protein secretion system
VSAPAGSVRLADPVSSFLSMPDGQQVPVRDGLVIGRVSGCDVVVDDTKASRRHARLCVDGGVVEIEDLGSSNGTLLNGKPVQRRMLRNGDEVTIGNTVLVYREAAAGTGAALRVADEDDVDLFGGDAPAAPVAAAPAPRPSPPAAPPTTAAPIAPAAPRPPVRPPVATSPPPVVSSVPPAGSSLPPAVSPLPPTGSSLPPAGIVEFADEVVEVRKTGATARATAAAGGAAPAPAGIQQKQRTLQFHHNVDRGGALGDDLGQLGGSARTLVYAAVLAGAVGVAWAIIFLMS